MDTFINSIGMRFIRISSGTFLMGASVNEVTSRNNERPTRSYQVNSFYIGIYPVTQGQYLELIGNNPSYFSSQGRGKEYVTNLNTSNYPVDSVSWEDAILFCQLLSTLPKEMENHRCYRLPTEREWEYACRAGTTTPFNIGNSFSSCDGNINGLYPYNTEIIGPTLKRTCEVGNYSPNAFGLYDMHGNVWEWCLDKYYRYENLESKGFNSRILRGGAWNCYSRFCRSAYRCIGESNVHYYDCGFRIICEVK